MSYDLIVIGGGHAGCEAALAGARMGVKTALITIRKDRIAQMSCNPAVGGLAKGQLVREIDAIGGEIGYCTDMTGIQFRILNRSKGPAVWSHRAQVDRIAYRKYMGITIHKQPGLTVIEDEVVDLLIDQRVCCGVVTVSRETFEAKTIIVTSGTFLNGVIHIGENQIPAGRIGEEPSKGLSECLVGHGLEMGRLKTGTPPRLNGTTINFDKCTVQYGDEPPPFFSRRSNRQAINQIQCHLTYTNSKTHQIINDNIKRSALYSGNIKGVGPRYCPSIEDKVVRFADKERHQLFLEPEGLNTSEYYLNGFSSSLPEEIQVEAVRTIPGLEEVKINQPAYAIEYDFFPPHQLKPTMESKYIKNLYLAGQVNGTSGYEEAAAQGLMASINAVLNIRGENPVVFDRSQAYIGVLIDDLVTKSTAEPYRMFTSRAEYRLFLREDNAEDRLSETGRRIGLLSESLIEKIFSEKKQRTDIYSEFQKLRISVPELEEPLTVAEAARRPEVDFTSIFNSLPNTMTAKYAVIEKVLIEIKYEGYLRRQQLQLQRFKSMESLAIPASFDYKEIKGLKTEASEKLSRIKPATLGQASRISGVSPGDIAVLMVNLKNRRRK
ncbi:MAG: tRNA uridine-5-carboxymethylaminomethyl(34) synthesis enzyme MnmG [candidate division Zixibacteria bacterium]|nr:tRNA uridine-5-carboxymethylaminomethyl(34) synthesis enzyme MnmG [candidate division Zixibacteria bacterium]